LKIFNKVYLRKSGEIEMPIFKGETAIKFLISFGIPQDIIQNYVNIR